MKYIMKQIAVLLQIFLLASVGIVGCFVVSVLVVNCCLHQLLDLVAS